MKNTFITLATSVTLLLAICSLSKAQTNNTVTTNANAEVTYAKKLGTTPPIRQLIPMAHMS